MKRSLEEYLDNFEGNVMLLGADVELLIENIEKNTITQAEVDETINILEEVTSIFHIHEDTCECAPTLESCISLLGSIKNIDNLNLHKKELIDILLDIKNAIDDFFVKRLNKDVYVFYHSIESNIQSLVHTVDGIVDDSDDDLEFF